MEDRHLLEKKAFHTIFYLWVLIWICRISIGHRFKIYFFAFIIDFVIVFTYSFLTGAHFGVLVQ